MLAVIIFFEIPLSCFIVWGILNENKLIEFENIIFSELTKKVKNIKIVKKIKDGAKNGY